MNKGLLAIIAAVGAFVVIVFVGGFLLVKNSDEKTIDEIKDILAKEKDALAGSNVYGEFIDVKKFKENGLIIDWFSETKTVNVKGKMVEGIVAKYETDFGTSLSMYILTADNVLYREYENEYSIIKLDENIKRIGVLTSFGGGECHPIFSYVLETDNGLKRIEEDFETDNIAVKKLDTKKSFVVPTCYGQNEKNSFANGFVKVFDDGTLQYVNGTELIKDKKSKKDIVAKYVLFIDTSEEQYYYIVTEDDLLYIVKTGEDTIEQLTKVDQFNIEMVKASSPDEDDSLIIRLKTGDTTIEVKNVLDRS